MRPNLEGEIHFKGGRFVTPQNFKFWYVIKICKKIILILIDRNSLLDYSRESIFSVKYYFLSYLVDIGFI
jgi:hypothetical protein